MDYNETLDVKVKSESRWMLHNQPYTPPAQCLSTSARPESCHCVQLVSTFMLGTLGQEVQMALPCRGLVPGEMFVHLMPLN